MAQRHSAEGRHSAPTFIGSVPDGPDQMVIELRGDLDAELLGRLALHIKDALTARTRFLVIDASAVTHAAPGLLDLLGRTQRRLARHNGLLTVRGLRRHRLPGGTPTEASGDLRAMRGRTMPRPTSRGTRPPSRPVAS